MTLPDLAWLNTIPVIGAKLYAGWHNLLDMGTAIMAKSPPLYWHHHHLVRWASGAYRALYGALCADASFSALLYWRGEQVAQGIRHFATRLAGVRGDAAVLLAAQAIRAVALGGGDGVSTGSAWRYRPRRIRRTLGNVANGVNDPFLPCPVWPVAGTGIPAIIWLLLDRRYLTLGNGIISEGVVRRWITSSAQC